MKINELAKRLRKKGLECELVTLYNRNGVAEQPAIMVDHNYSGYYPTRAALDAHELASVYARRNGYKSEPRGCYTATLIWEV